ncbi:MAG TPA: hypothetical protein VE912_23195 [Bacteroidales bacterium]|nr:hypothetical protein [Bacteroidales bacterium]
MEILFNEVVGWKNEGSASSCWLLGTCEKMETLDNELVGMMRYLERMIGRMDACEIRIGKNPHDS